MKALLVALLVLVAVPATAQTPIADAIRAIELEAVSQAPRPPAPSWHQRVDVALGITSLSASAVASTLTMVCTSQGLCREVIPTMRKWIGDGIVKATVTKAVLNGAAIYLVYRFIPEGKLRTFTLAAMAGANVYDAGNDIRVFGQVSRRQ